MATGSGSRVVMNVSRGVAWRCRGLVAAEMVQRSSCWRDRWGSFAGPRTRRPGMRASVLQWSALVPRSGSVIGCSGSFGSEEELSCGESLDDVHGAVAKRTVPESRLDVGGCGVRRYLLVEQAPAERKQFSAFPIGHPSEVADPWKPLGQHMLHEATQELIGRKRHGALPTLVRIVFPAKNN